MINKKCGVYFFFDGKEVRIGMSEDVEKRLKTHKSSNSKIEVLGIINCLENELRLEESKAFNYFKEYLINNSFYSIEIIDLVPSYIIKRTLEKNNIKENPNKKGTTIGTLYGPVNILSIRKRCDIFPDQPAAIIGRAGTNEKYRKIKIGDNIYTVSEKFKKLYQQIIRDIKDTI
jgi:hypothetical protein